MKINFTTELKGLDGNFFPTDKKTNLTVRDACVLALNHVQTGHTNLSSDESTKRFKLMKFIKKNDEGSLLAEQIVLIKENASKIFTPDLFGAIIEILEPSDENI